MVVVKTNRTVKTQRRTRRRSSRRNIYQPKRFLLTKNEAAFFRVLVMLLDSRYLVSCKVRLADIITCADRDWKTGHGSRVAQKHVDFVVSWADSSRIVSAIELDDRSHETPERQERDAFVNQLFRKMHVTLIRIPARWAYKEAMVARHVLDAGLRLKKEIDPGSISQKPMNLRRINPKG